MKELDPRPRATSEKKSEKDTIDEHIFDAAANLGVNTDDLEQAWNAAINASPDDLE